MPNCGFRCLDVLQLLCYLPDFKLALLLHERQEDA